MVPKYHLDEIDDLCGSVNRLFNGDCLVIDEAFVVAIKLLIGRFGSGPAWVCPLMTETLEPVGLSSGIHAVAVTINLIVRLHLPLEKDAPPYAILRIMGNQIPLNVGARCTTKTSTIYQISAATLTSFPAMRA